MPALPLDSKAPLVSESLRQIVDQVFDVGYALQLDLLCC